MRKETILALAYASYALTPTQPVVAGDAHISDQVIEQILEESKQYSVVGAWDLLRLANDYLNTDDASVVERRFDKTYSPRRAGLFYKHEETFFLELSKELWETGRGSNADLIFRLRNFRKEENQPKTIGAGRWRQFNRHCL